MLAEQKFQMMEKLFAEQKYQDAIKAGHEAESSVNCVLNPEEEEMEFNPIKLSIMNKLADIYLDLNNPHQALSYLIRIVQTLKGQAKADVKMLGGTYAKIGKACFYGCHYDYSAYFLKLGKKILEDAELVNTNEMGLTLLQLGNYYRFMFQDEEAEKILQQSIDIRSDLLGPDSVEVAESLHGLAQLYTDMGQLGNSSNMIDQAITILTTRLGPKHIKTAKSLYLKGNLQLRQQSPNLKEAESLINESLAINQEIVGEYFLETADCYHSLGKIKALNMQSEGYLEYFNKALLILEQIYGKAHASIAILLNNLGKAQYDRKKYEEAVQCFTRSIEIYKQICGNVHGNLAITLKSSADCHKHLGRLKEAHSEYSLSLKIYEVVNVAKNPQKIQTDFNYTKQQIKKLLTETETED